MGILTGIVRKRSYLGPMAETKAAPGELTIRPLTSDTCAFARLAERHHGVFGGCWWLVFDDDEAVAWCEYGTPQELPNIYHRKEYEAQLDRLPDYRITCMFVDKKHRRKGMTAVALRGALDLISQAGGGVVEAYPHDTNGQKVSVLYNGTRSLFEQAGFSYVRPKGTKNCVMRKEIP